MEFVDCSQCGYPVSQTRESCPFCGAAMAAPKPPPAPATKPPTVAAAPAGSGASALNILGALLLIAGIIVIIYFVAAFDVSVPVDYGALQGYSSGLPDRVNNLGLMNTQRNGIIVGALLAAGGVVMLVLGFVKSVREGAASVSTPEKKYPYCAETIKADAVICRFCNRDVSGAEPVGS